MDTTVDPDLLLEFFLGFSRFEHALKASGFLHARTRREAAPLAEPDWKAFGRSVHRAFRPRRTPELRSACAYMRQAPPLIQIVIDGQPGWDTEAPPVNRRGVEFIVEMVRRVRNNLFHGGKHGIDPHEAKERTELLLRSSLLVLAECLQVSPRVRQAYDEAVL